MTAPLAARFPRTCALLCGALLALPAAPARALFHSPHDAIEAWVISPDFARDRTLLVALPRFNLVLRSRDAGASFEVVNAGLDTAYVLGLAVSPDFARDRTLYCAEVAHVFVSRDGGDHWQPLPLPDGLRDVSSFAVSPDFANDGTLALSTRRDGLWMSRDRGATWSSATLPAPDAAASPGAGSTDHPCFSPAFAHDRTLFVLHDDRDLLRSTDGGATFAAQGAPPGGGLQALAVGTERAGGDDVHDTGAGAAHLLWVGTRGRGVFHSRDGGASWQAAAEPLAHQNVQHIALARDADDGDVVFASTATDGIFVRAGDGPWRSNRSGFRDLTDQSTLHYHGALPSPDFAHDRTVFAATFEGLYVSRTGGDGWTWLDVLQPRIVRNLALSPDFAEDGTLWLSTYGLGLLEASPAPSAATASPDSTAIAGGAAAGGGLAFRLLDTLGWMFPDGIAISPDVRNDRTLMVGAPNRLLISTDRGATARPTLSAKKTFARALAFAPDFARSGIAFAYLSTYTGSSPLTHRFARTADRGDSWQDTNLVAVDDMVFAPDWEASGRMYAASPDGMYRSDDRGLTFGKVESLDTQGCGSVAVAAGSAAGAASDIVLACSRFSGLHLSRDGGATWTHLDGGLGGIRCDFVEMSPDFARDGLAFAGPRTDGVFVTRDGGATWTRSPGGARVVLAMERSPTFARDRTLLVGSYDGAWLTRDAAASWTALDIPLPPDWKPVFSK